MKYLQLIIILMAGIHKSLGYCELGHLFQPVSSEGTPCNPLNLDCIRIFFVNTWVCIDREGLLPQLANITEFNFPAPSSNMSATGYGIEIEGIRTGRSLQLYNRPLNDLAISTEWPCINIHAQKVVVHRPDMNDVVVTDFDIRLDYILILGIFVSTEITISRNLRTFVEKVHQPLFDHGPEHSTEELNILFNVLLQDATVMIQELFVIRGANFMQYLKSNNLCQPNRFFNSDGSVCGSVGSRRRGNLGPNSTIPSQ